MYSEPEHRVRLLVNAYCRLPIRCIWISHACVAHRDGRQFSADPPSGTCELPAPGARTADRHVMCRLQGMPRGSTSKYSSKQKRQAHHIDEGAKSRGYSSKRAAQIGYATVNK